MVVGVLLDDRQQFAEVVGVAQCVPGVVVVAAVGLEPVMDGDTREVGQHAGVIDAVVAALVVQRVERQPLVCWTANSQRSRPSTRAPVSSKCATGALISWRCTSSKNPCRSSAPVAT